MSGSQPHDLPSGEAPGAGSDEARSDSSAVPGEHPVGLAGYAAMPDEISDDDVIDISVNEGQGLTTDVPDVDPGPSAGARPIPDDEP